MSVSVPPVSPGATTAPTLVTASPYGYAGQPLTGTSSDHLSRVEGRLLILQHALQAAGSDEGLQFDDDLDRQTYFGHLAEDVAVMRAEVKRGHALDTVQANLLYLATDNALELPREYRGDTIAKAEAAGIDVPALLRERAQR